MDKKKYLITIEKSKLLLVEGKDEVFFFNTLLKKINIQGVQVHSSGGKEKFKQEFRVIVNTRGFDKLKSLAIIQDADNDPPSSTFKKICSVFQTLRESHLKPPVRIDEFTDTAPRTGVFIIPDGQNQGKLESLCLSTVCSEPVMECVDSFMNCIKQKSNLEGNRYRSPKDIHKARCRAFLSAMEEDIPSLGIATEKGYWNLDSEKLQPLINLLNRI